jgi:arsenite methyltransferase
MNDNMPRISQHIIASETSWQHSPLMFSIGCTIHLYVACLIYRTSYTMKVQTMSETDVKDFVKQRYSEIARQEASCCCSCDSSSRDTAHQIGYTDDDLNAIPEEASMGLGCGNPVAQASLQEGETVLDLGSGGGIDVFLAAKKVGPGGKVIGIDMTQIMIEKARSLAATHGYENVEFRLGEIEHLPVDNESIDVIISNCVINLAPDKAKVFNEASRVLKSGGRILISDLVTEGELPPEVKKNFDAWACCIGGALEKNQYLTTIQNAGFTNVHIVKEATYDLGVYSQELQGKITSIQVEAHKI